MKKKLSHLNIFKQYIVNTEYKIIVPLFEIRLCYVTQEFKDKCGLSKRCVWINSKVIKHIYDNHQKDSYEIMLNLIPIIKSHDFLYKRISDNTDDKIYLLKYINKVNYFCVLEKNLNCL